MILRQTRTIRGKVHALVVLRVVEKDGDGPRLFKLLREDETVKVENDMEFWSVWVPEENIIRWS